jgi:hypothetical protein
MRLLVVTMLAALVSAGTAQAEAGPQRVTGVSPLNCAAGGDGTLQKNSEVQTHLAVNPRNPLHLVGTYQQDRWSSLASQGVLTVTSFDGGRTWRRSSASVSECTGGPTSLKRATDSWTSISPDGTAYLATLSMTGGFFEPGSQHAIQVTRSGSGGLTWANPVTLTQDGGLTVFNDLPAVTADPADARFVYVVWTRIELLGGQDFAGVTYLARSTDGGRTWDQRPIHDPGRNNQTVANKIVVRPDGTLVNVFTRFVGTQDIRAITSADHGRTWSAPVHVADLAKVGAKDPETGTPIRDGSDFAQVAADDRGNVHIAWQDSRFHGGQQDGIVMSTSADGRTWTPPAAVSSGPAFSPALAVQRDGTVGVTYYDLRHNTSDPATLPTSYWLTTPHNGREQRIATFDIASAPRVDRPVPSYYLGDYHGLVASGNRFVPLFPMAGRDSADPSDVFTTRVHPG